VRVEAPAAVHSLCSIVIVHCFPLPARPPSVLHAPPSPAPPHFQEAARSWQLHPLTSPHTPNPPLHCEGSPLPSPSSTPGSTCIPPTYASGCAPGSPVPLLPSRQQYTAHPSHQPSILPRRSSAREPTPLPPCPHPFPILAPAPAPPPHLQEALRGGGVCKGGKAVAAVLDGHRIHHLTPGGTRQGEKWGRRGGSGGGG
jgi:hypothetical protein